MNYCALFVGIICAKILDSNVYGHYNVAIRTNQPHDKNGGNNMKNENREYCKRIAMELEAYANGHMYQDENGETVYSEEYRDDLDQLYIGDYLSTEVLDFDIMIGSDWEYESCKLYVTLGGPNVWIDTAEKAVKLAWGTDREEYGLDWDVCDEIDQYWAETYECERGGR